MAKVKVSVENGPNVEVDWTQNMNAQQALELAWVALEEERKFTYTLQYFGQYGYMVSMINETYDTFMSTYAPYYYWEFLVNGQPQNQGIDGTTLNEGDQVSFAYGLYTTQEASPQLAAKHETYMQALKAQ